MKKSKIRVAIVFGGRSAEHEVSLQSAKNIIDSIDQQKYEPVLIGIDREGRWLLNDASIPLLNAEDPKNILLNESGQSVALIPGENKGQLIGLSSKNAIEEIDAIFPVLHGPYGEDGSIQGLAKLANLPCVGSGILGSAISMDKDVSKRLLRDGGILVAEYIIVQREKIYLQSAESIVDTLGLPVFVKPANLGSSVGISKADSVDELIDAVSVALQFDSKVLVEETIYGREIECAVLGNDDPIASIPGEIIPSHDFYSYEAKYIDEHGAALQIPAELNQETRQEIQNTAVDAFRLLECQGMARVDMFLTDAGNIYVNEVNTIPGFTAISMYPKLWEFSGVSYAELIDRLIQYAIEAFQKRANLKIKR